MTIKEIRSLTGLSQKAFAAKYEIPCRSIVNWELPAESSNHRDCPPYVIKLLERVVKEDYAKA